MLKKLLKYDLIWIYKFLIIFYSIAVFFAILTRIFTAIGGSVMMTFLSEFCGGVTISMFISAIINNLTRLWLRFSRNFYGDESYLTHTLPVKKSTLFLSKTLTAFITVFSSVLVAVFACFIAYYSKENMQTLKNVLFAFADAYETSVLGLLIALVLLLYLEIATALMAGYLGTILGHRRNGAKTGFSVLFGFLVYMSVQTAVILVISTAGIFFPDLTAIYKPLATPSVGVLKALTAISIVTYSVLLAFVYFISLKLFKRGVNVD